MSAEYGIWSDETDGFVEDGFWSRREAQRHLERLGLEPGDRVRAICPDHEEQPKDACEECYR
jgi:hypothetical protein